MTIKSPAESKADDKPSDWLRMVTGEASSNPTLKPSVLPDGRTISPLRGFELLQHVAASRGCGAAIDSHDPDRAKVARRTAMYGDR